MKSPSKRSENQSAVAGSCGTPQKTSESPPGTPGDRGAAGGFRATVTAAQKVKRAPRGRKVKKRRTAQLIKNTEIREMEDSSLESSAATMEVKKFAIKVGAKDKTNPKSLKQAREEYESCNNEYQQYEAFLDEYSKARESVRRLCLRAALNHEQLASDAVMAISKIGVSIGNALSTSFDARPELVRKVAEKSILWPTVQYPTNGTRKRESQKLAQLNIGDKVTYKIKTASTSCAAITAIARHINSIIRKLREPADIYKFVVKYVKLGWRLEECRKNLHTALIDTASNTLELPRHKVPRIDISQITRKYKSDVTSIECIDPELFELYAIYSFKRVPALSIAVRFRQSCCSLPPPSKVSSKLWVEVALEIFELVSGGQPETCRDIVQIGLNAVKKKRAEDESREIKKMERTGIKVNRPIQVKADSELSNDEIDLMRRSLKNYFEKTFLNQLPESKDSSDMEEIEPAEPLISPRRVSLSMLRRMNVT